jgi:hypothetical protein
MKYNVCIICVPHTGGFTLLIVKVHNSQVQDRAPTVHGLNPLITVTKVNSTTYDINTQLLNTHNNHYNCSLLNNRFINILCVCVSHRLHILTVISDLTQFFDPVCIQSLNCAYYLFLW